MPTSRRQLCTLKRIIRPVAQVPFCNPAMIICASISTKMRPDFPYSNYLWQLLDLIRISYRLWLDEDLPTHFVSRCIQSELCVWILFFLFTLILCGWLKSTRDCLSFLDRHSLLRWDGDFLCYHLKVCSDYSVAMMNEMMTNSKVHH